MNAASNESGGTVCDTASSLDTLDIDTTAQGINGNGLTLTIINDNGETQYIVISPEDLSQYSQSIDQLTPNPNPQQYQDESQNILLTSDHTSPVPQSSESLLFQTYQLPNPNSDNLQQQQTTEQPLYLSTTTTDQQYYVAVIQDDNQYGIPLSSSINGAVAVHSDSSIISTDFIPIPSLPSVAGNEVRQESKKQVVAPARKRPRKQPISNTQPKADYYALIENNVLEPSTPYSEPRIEVESDLGPQYPSKLQISDARWGLPFKTDHLAEDTLPIHLEVPSTVYREFDTSLKATTLPLSNFAVKFATKVAENLTEANLIRADLLTSKRPGQASRVLRLSSIENKGDTKSQACVTTYALDENKGLEQTTDKLLPSSDFLIRPRILFLIHPIIRYTEEADVLCSFPLEKLDKTKGPEARSDKIISASLSHKGKGQLEITKVVYHTVEEYLKTHFTSKESEVHKIDDKMDTNRSGQVNSYNQYGDSNPGYQLLVPAQPVRETNSNNSQQQHSFLSQSSPIESLHFIRNPMRLVYAITDPSPVTSARFQQQSIDGTPIEANLSTAKSIPVKVFVGCVQDHKSSTNFHMQLPTTANVGIASCQNNSDITTVLGQTDTHNHSLNGIIQHSIQPNKALIKPKTTKSNAVILSQNSKSMKQVSSLVPSQSCILSQSTSGSQQLIFVSSEDQQPRAVSAVISQDECQKRAECVIPKPSPRTDPVMRKGFMAMCPNCGICSDNLHTCVRCKKEIPVDTKIIPDDWNKDPPPGTTLKPQILVSQAVAPQPLLKQVPTVLKRPVLKKPKTPTFPKKSKGGGKRTQECIVLSSDDDEQEGPRSKVLKAETNTEGSQTKELRVNLIPVFSATNSAVVAAINKHSSVPAPPDTQIIKKGPECVDHDEVLRKIETMISTKPAKENFAQIECRSVRIGNWKYTSPSGNSTATFSKDGILFNAVHSQRPNIPIKCAIPYTSVLRIVAHFKHRLLVIIITTGPRYATSLRKRLGFSEDPDIGYYFCPSGGIHQKNIVLLPTTISEVDVAVIRELFSPTLQEIDYIKANQILMEIAVIQEDKPNLNSLTKQNAPLSTPTATNSIIVNNVPSCTNTTMLLPRLADHLHQNQVDICGNKILLSYKGIEILQQDISCLAVEQFLNDSILDFWLRYIDNEILSPEDRERTYMFSTFFYKRLTTKPKKRNGGTTTLEENSTLSNAEKRHARVKRWTKNVDLFEKDFIIIPINESCHWFLAVICYPGLNGVHNFETGEPLPNYRSNKKRSKARQVDSSTENPSNGEFSSDKMDTNIVPNLELITSNNLSMQENVDSIREKVRIKQPCILILDSLAGEPRNRVYSTLREYLKMEYKTRKGEEREFNKSSMPGDMPKVIQQPNHCDCGIFTLFYVEHFFRTPIKSFDFPIDDGKMLWQKVIWETKREEIYQCIKDLVKKSNPEDLQMIPRLIFPQLKPKKEKIKEQIESAPVAKLEKINESEEPMDIDVDSGDNLDECNKEVGRCITSISNKSSLPKTIAEMTRASPEDNDHDHAYTPIPSRNPTPT